MSVFRMKRVNFDIKVGRPIIVFGDSFARDLVNILLSSGVVEESRVIYSDEKIEYC
jgi:hypothetical protein